MSKFIGLVHFQITAENARKYEFLYLGKFVELRSNQTSCLSIQIGLPRGYQSKNCQR